MQRQLPCFFPSKLHKVNELHEQSKRGLNKIFGFKTWKTSKKTEGQALILFPAGQSKAGFSRVGAHLSSAAACEAVACSRVAWGLSEMLSVPDELP